MTHRSLAFALFAVACHSKSDAPSRMDCAPGDACTSSGGPAEESSSGGGDESTVTAVTSEPTTTPTTSPTTSASGDEGSSGGPAETGGEESTGEPADNLYAPCTSDDDCTSGVCAYGLCSQECWSVEDGETPCPALPDGTDGVTITCGSIGQTGAGHLCEICPDCPQHCIAVCDDTSTCPDGSYCIFNLCFDQGSYCGVSGGEYDDDSCSDGYDNDDDGYVDCDDFDCSMSDTVTVCGGGENTDASCDDGIDNDEDGYVDCDDFDCSMNPGVTVCP